MRVAMISTYPPAACGIARYSQALVSALRVRAPSISVHVLAEGEAWSRDRDWPRQVLDALADVDIIHVQHEEAIFGQDGRLAALFEARVRGVRTVVTLHSVYDERFPMSLFLPGRSFHRALGRVCDAIVAHQRHGMADVLISHGVPAARVHVIAHGTPELALPDRATARAALHLPNDAPIAMFFGFIHHRKNLHVAVRAFDRVATRHADARFLIAGPFRRAGIWDERYHSRLWLLMRRRIEDGRILYHPGFVPDELKPLYFAAADLVVLPHDQAYGSASGVLHEAIGARRAVLCARGKKFAELEERLGTSFELPRARDVDAWERDLETLLYDGDARRRLVDAADRLAHETSWSSSADRHAAMYGRLTEAPFAHSA